MNIEEIRDYCLGKKGVTESFPFNETVLVFKVMNKMFLLSDLEGDGITLKNDPEKNLQLREEFVEIIDAFHMNKMHWNTVQYKSAISNNLLKELIDESYDIIIKSLTKKKQEEFRNL